MIHTFDADRHVYTLQEPPYLGLEVPSATGVLKHTKLVSYEHIDADILENRRGLGALVHKATAIVDKGYDLGNLPIAALGYCRSWEELERTAHYKWDEIETPRVELVSGMPLAGTPDRVGTYESRGAVVDIKISRQYEAWWGIQLACYALMVSKGNVDFARLVRRYVVQLHEDGGPARVHEFDDPADIDMVRAALCVTWWKKNHGYRLN